MTYFFDTSALVKLFSQESGSDKIQEIVVNENSECWVSDLAFVELYSALCRKLRNKEIKNKQFEIAVQGIREQLDDFKIYPLAHPVVEESLRLLQDYGNNFGLRTLDALHIASWILCSEDDWIFVSADEIQLKVVKKLKGNIINPTV